MNKINQLTLLLLFTLSFSLSANVYQQLLSNEIINIKIASKTMFSGQENHQENSDLLAEILLSKYKNAQPSEIDTLSWACKALGATEDGRYRNLLIEISKSNAHKKLKSYAKKSYKLLPESTNQYIQGSVDLADLQNKIIKDKPILPRADLSESERMLFSIAKGDLSSIKNIAKSIYKKSESNSIVSDALSEYALLNYKNVADYQADTLAWVFRALGELDTGRYSNVMQIVSEDSNNVKVRKYARIAFKNSPKEGEYYIKGDINFDAIIDKYKAP